MKNLRENWFKKKGAEFVHILQPNWLTYENLSDKKSEDKRFSDMRVIQEIFKSNASQESRIVDFTDRLNSLNDTPFLDWAHLDEIGNEKIAEEMFAVLKPILTK